MGLAQFAGRERLDIAARAALLAGALQSSGSAAMEVIFGAGLIALDDSSIPQLVPVALVNSEKVDHPRGQTSLSEVGQALQIANNALGLDANSWLEGVRAWVMLPPSLRLSPGDRISSPAIGKIGCAASWTGGSGFLTAGHVAQAYGKDVYVGGSHVGTVAYANDPRNGGTAIEADIGIVEYANGAFISPPPRLSGTALASPSSSVTVHARAAASADIMGYCSYIFLPSIYGTLGDTYFTTKDVTSGGDSGSATSAQNSVVGIVVAGSAGFTTYIQDIHYLLAQSGPQASGLKGLIV